MDEINKITAKLISAISLYHDCEPEDFVNALIGLAWDEETAGDIIRYLNE